MISAVIVAALLFAEPPATYPPDPLWTACREGEPGERVKGCARIADDTEFDLKTRSWALVLEGSAHADLGNTDEAIADLDRAIRMDPGNAIAYRLKGDLHLQKKELTDALADIEQAIELAPEDPYNLLSQAVYFRTTGDLAEARRAVDHAILIDPDLPDLYFERGRIALLLDDSEQAIRDFEKYRAIGPGDPAADFNLALSYQSAGRYIEADAAIDRFIETAPGDAKAIQTKAEIAFGLRELDSALADIEKAIALDPKDLTFIYDRARIRSERGELHASIADFTAALPAYPGDPTILVGRGSSHFRAGEDKEALADARAALLIDAKSADAHWLEASALLFLERYDEALDALERGLAAAPDDARFLVIRGRVFLAQGNAVGAIAAFSAALEMDPDSTEAVSLRASAGADLGLVDAARETLAHVLETDPDNTTVLEQAAYVSRKAGDAEAALAYLGRLTELWPEVPVYWWEKGQALTALKYSAAAPSAYAKAIELYGGEIPVQLLRDQGDALIETGQYREAAASLRAALEKEPADAWTFGEFGFAQQKAGENAAAVVHLKRAIMLYKGSGDGDIFRLYLADAYAALRDYPQALREYDSLLADYPSDSETLAGRGAAYAALKQDAVAFGGAGPTLKQPEFVAAVIQLCRQRVEDGHEDAALDLIAETIDAAPDDVRPLFERALLLKQRGNFHATLSDLDRALALDPSSDFALNERADTFLLLGRLEDARADALRVTSLHPDYPVGWVTLGQILIETDDINAAVTALSRAIELDIAGADAFYYRAVAYARLGLNEAALVDLASAARRDDGQYADRIAELRRKATG